MSWEWPVVIYLWLAGMAGGAYFVTFLAALFSGQYHEAKRVAAALGVPSVILGVLMLLVDLGHPFRAWHLFGRFRIGSPMSVGSWLLLIWAVLATVLFAIWWSETATARRLGGGMGRFVGFLQRFQGLARILDWIEVILSVLLIAYTGVLLSAGSPPLWSSTVLLPALFVASAVATGIAVLNLAGALGVGEVSRDLMAKLCKAGAVVCSVEILALAGLLLLMTGAGASLVYAAEASGSACTTCSTFTLASVQAMNTVLLGPLSFAFWAGVVLVGLVLPLGVEFGMILRGVEKPAREVAIVLGLMVLIGGFILRAVVVFGGQM
ncbi:MAG TPA: hypothetical protein ENJ31_07685 [Anaerolineae bacterium]|nr:hypothetical protein [Anaerolineae bacterium]